MADLEHIDPWPLLERVQLRDDATPLDALLRPTGFQLYMAAVALGQRPAPAKVAPTASPAGGLPWPAPAGRPHGPR